MPRKGEKSDPLVRITQYIRRDDFGCWVWAGGRSGSGYGAFWIDGKTRPAHVVMYEICVGPVPAGLELDHVCRNRACCNPDHLEPVTNQVNVWRSLLPTCKAGHELSGDNLYMHPTSGQRTCRACHARWTADYRKRAA